MKLQEAIDKLSRIKNKEIEIFPTLTVGKLLFLLQMTLKNHPDKKEEDLKQILPIVHDIFEIKINKLYEANIKHSEH